MLPTSSSVTKYLSELQSVNEHKILFPIYMHSLLKFELLFGAGGIKNFETISRARLAATFWT